MSSSAVLRLTFIAFLILFVLPLAAHGVWWRLKGGTNAEWSRVDWSSAGLLPAPATLRGPLVRIYAARVGRWRGIFAHHSWIVIKEAGATRYTRYDVVGWGRPVRTDAYAPDGRWYGNDPEVVLSLDGEAAARAIAPIRAAVADYPHRAEGTYRAWPGPNSNTFVAHVLTHIPDHGAALPPTAIGKDWSPAVQPVERTPSGTGLRVGLGGYAGLTLGWVEGIEINILGAVAGLDLRRPALKVPGWGRIEVPGPWDPEDRVPAIRPASRSDSGSA